MIGTRSGLDDVFRAEEAQVLDYPVLGDRFAVFG
jgi:hypothetical protein